MRVLDFDTSLVTWVHSRSGPDEGRYSAAFVIPRGSTKRLDTDGWTFLHDGVVSPEVKEGLIRELGLDFIDSYDEAEKYGA
ncbi:hypothetical protein [Dyella sp. 333MFSha]|uniref:hypothetical protein n=1 Tax=Dyella sp. 333MFSha TaxID=1798240 RepID=UPI0015A49E9A|nr:hypothetical protein [Dyella sp. 333MFSha]